MDKYQIGFNSWNKVAQLYQEKFMDVDLYNDSYNEFCALLNTSKPKVLDIGCGPGNISRYLISRIPKIKILGIDASPNMINLAKTNNPKADFLEMDCRNLDQIKDKFDGIICGFCFPYLSLEDCSKLLLDCANILNPEGVLYCSFIEGDYRSSGYQTGSTGDQMYTYFHDENSIKGLFKLNNIAFNLTSRIPYLNSKNESSMHRILLGKKL